MSSGQISRVQHASKWRSELTPATRGKIMKLAAHGYSSARFVTRPMYKLSVSRVVIAMLAGICCGANVSAEEAGGQVLSPQRIRSITSAIDGNAIIANAKATKDWLSYGLDYSESRYSKLS